MLGLLFECEEKQINLKFMLPVYFLGPGLLLSLGYLVLIYVPVYNEKRTSCFPRNWLLCLNFLLFVLRDFLNDAWSLTSCNKMYSFLSVVLHLITSIVSMLSRIQKILFVHQEILYISSLLWWTQNYIATILSHWLLSIYFFCLQIVLCMAFR